MSTSVISTMKMKIQQIFKTRCDDLSRLLL